MSNDITTKINTLLTTDSRYVNISRSDALAQMVQDGVITQAQYEEAISTTVFANTAPTQEASNETTAGMMGATFSNTTPTNPTQTEQTKQKRFHPVFKNLMLTSDGKVDSNQFSLESLRQRYNEQDFLIEEDENTPLTVYNVYNRQTGKIVETISEYPTMSGWGSSSAESSFSITSYDREGNQKLTINVANNQLQGVEEYYENGASKYTEYRNGDYTQIVSVINSELDKIITTNYDINNNISEKIVVDLNNRPISRVLYQNGRPHAEYGIYGNNITKSYIAEDLANKLKSGDVEAIKDIIFNKITPETIYETILGYQSKEKSALLKDILSSEILDDVTKQEIIAHLDNTSADPNLSSDKKGYYIASKIVALTNKEDLMSEILALNSNNVDDVMQYIGVYGYQIGYFNLVALKSLTTLINDFGFTDEEKLLLTNHLSDILIECSQTSQYNHIYSDDIISDIQKNRNDFKKLDIDMQRLISRLHANVRPGFNDVANGEIDKAFFQGGTGDCWLLAGIRSVISNEDGLRELNDMISVDESGNVTVELRGVDKTYTIPADVIAKSNYLSVGDADIRAIEIAVDTYFKEQAYQNGETEALEDQTDIWGDLTRTFYDLFFGNSKYMDNIDVSEFNFNKKNRVFSIGHSNREVQLTAYNVETNEPVNFVYNHAYSVLGNDDDYLYFQNPYDFDTQYYIERKALRGIEFDVSTTEVS